VTTEPLLTIGSFARAVGLTPSALRHYDECGLLPPAATDPVTGYRYYTPELARRARLVAALREAAVPIDTMRVVVDGEPEVAHQALRDLLDARAERAVREEAALAAVLREVDSVAHPESAAVATAVDGRALAAALRQVRAAADVDPASPLSSVLLDVTPEGVDVVATNRFWMALRTLHSAGNGSGRAVLALPTATRLAAALDGAGDVSVEVRGDAALVRGETYAGRDVAYPAHRVVLDGLDQPTTTAVVASQQLAEAVDGARRAEVALELSHEGVLVGDRRLDGTVSGAGLRIVVGSALLLRGLAVCLGAEVVLEASTPERPLRLSSPYQAGFLALVMPIRPE
jgi:DNA-binding transcriptional MerR regulator